MSARAKALWNLYRKHRITLEGVQKALEDGQITQEEYDMIIA